MPGPDVIDARLAVGAGAAWIVTFAGLRLPAPVALHIAIVFGSVGLVALLADRTLGPAEQSGHTAVGGNTDDDLARRAGPGAGGNEAAVRRRSGAGAALACFCCAGTLMSLGWHLEQVRSGPIPVLVAQHSAGEFEVTVAGDPRAVSSAASFGPARVVLAATLTGAHSGAVRYSARVPVVVLGSAEAWSDLVPGQHVRLDGRLAPPPPGQLLVASINARGPPTLIGRPPAWQRAAEAVRRGLQRSAAGLPSAERGLLPGLVDGDTSNLDPRLADQFRAAGLTHLVAVSGTNAAILIGAVLLLLRRLRAPPWSCALIGGAILFAFVAVARPSPSVVRAAVMAAVLLFALATGRPRQGLPSLSLAVMVLLMWHPDWAANAGFAMSALATGALFLVAPGWADALRRRHVFPVLAEGLAVSAAATVVSAPIIVLISGRVSLVALPANVLAEIAVAPATVLGVLAAATGTCSPFLGAAFAQAAGIPCRWLVADAQWFASLPGATISWPNSVSGAAGLAILTAVAIVLLRFPLTRRPTLAALLTILIVEIPGRALSGGWAPRDAILVACDVGQGDGIVLPVGPHAAVVMDSGPEPIAIDRCLHSLGITSVPLYIQSHFDLDHVGGMAGVADRRQIGRVITGPLQAPALGRGILTRALAPLHISSQIVAPGAEIDEGRLRLHVLESHIVDVDGQPDSNNSSLIIRATTAGHSILLTGDASTEAQQALLASGQDVHADVLKVPHHGSAYFDPDFITAVHPRLAVISVGQHNSYGQPAPKLLAALVGLHVPVQRTDVNGDVAVTADADGLQVIDHRPSARLSAGAQPAARAPARCGPARCGPAISVAGPAGPGHVDGADVGERMRSAGRATMEPCPPRPKVPPTVTLSVIAVSSWSSATRTSWSDAPSSRSPPRAAGPPRTRR